MENEAKYCMNCASDNTKPIDVQSDPEWKQAYECLECSQQVFISSKVETMIIDGKEEEIVNIVLRGQPKYIGRLVPDEYGRLHHSEL